METGPGAEATWRLLARISDEIRRDLDRELGDRGILTEAEFTVLQALVPHGDEGCPQATCAETIGWERSRLSHQLQRMERRGLVCRERGGVAADLRRTSVRTTEAGRAAYHAALRPRSRVIRQRFDRALSAEGLASLADALRLLSDSPDQ